MKRSGPLKRSPLVAKGRKNPVPPDVYASVVARDGSCRAYARGFAIDVRCDGRPHVHHRLPRSRGGQHTMANLLVLCDLHHHLAHRVRMAEALASGVILRTSADA
jgi:5-methylcytosine-specific restriction endonuclease McrA